MKILYDYQAFYMQKFGGVSNSIVQIISNLPPEVKYEIAIKECNNEHLQKSGLVKFAPARNSVDKFISSKSFKGKQRLYNTYTKLFSQRTSLGRNQLYAIQKLVNGDFDIFHPTFFDGYFIPYLNGKPFVMTIHDMIPERLCIKDGQIAQKKYLVDKASHIATISEQAKYDIMEILKVPESKISVIYHGAPQIKVPGDMPIPVNNYILYVGLRESYKYFMPMMKSLLPVLKRHPGIKIVCTGPDFTNAESSFFEQEGISDRMFHTRPSDKEMAALYSNALCFIYPSLYEGFGIPILEAYQANCPVILNHKSCFPEIAKDAALFFDSDDASSSLEILMESFLQMSSDEKENLLKKQRARLDFFSWEKAAKQYKDLYEALI